MDKLDTFVSAVAILHDQTDLAGPFAREASDLLARHYTNFEVVLLDNGSHDGTAATVQPLLQQVRCLRYVRLSRGMDSETAFTAALDAAIGDFVVTLNPDFDPVDEIPAMVERCRAGSDIVLGVDADPKRHGPIYRMLREAYFAATRKALGVELPRGTTGFRALSRHAVNALTQFRQRRRYFALVASAIGFEPALHPYKRISRTGAKPDSSVSKAARIGVALVVHNSTLPLRLASITGLIGSLLSFLYSFYVLGIFFFKRDVAPGWTTLSLQVSGLFFLAFVVLALLGEYIARLLAESSDRPLYYVREEKSSSVPLAEPGRRNVLDNSAAEPAPAGVRRDS